MDQKIISSKKIKIAFLSRYLGEVNRGAETYVIELSKRLSKYFQVDILKQQQADDIDLIMRGNYQLVIPTNGRFQALKASLGRIQGKYKTLISGQAGIGRDDIFNIAVTCPNIYVALTEQEKIWSQKWAWKSKVIKIPNGADLDIFTPNGPKANISLPKPVILSVGALEWYKHHELTIRALAKLQFGSLLIIGDGSEKERLTRLGKDLLGEERFQIVAVPFSEIPKYYRSADLFTLPSWDREAFGIVYVEALASNLPVVAPDDLARREIVGDGGLLTNVENIDNFSKTINLALQKKWENKPRDQAKKFSWDIIANNYKKLIENICQ